MLMAEENNETAVSVKQVFQAALVLLVGLALWHGPVLIGRDVLCGGDLVNQFYPIRMGQIERGWFVGWQPETFSGRPVLGDIQLGVFYPLHWLYPLLGEVVRTTGYLTLLHFLAGGMGVYTLARVMLRHPGAMLAAFLWTFSTYIQLRITNGVVIFIQAFAFLPWMLLAAEKMMLAGGRPLAWCAVLGLLGGLQITVGAAQVCQITWVGIGIWVLLRAWMGEVTLRDSARMIGGFTLAAVASVVVAAAPLISALRFQAHAMPRTSPEGLLEYLGDGSILPRVMVTWLLPHFYGPGNSEEFYWGSPFGYTETTMYIGIVAMVLAAFAMMFAVLRPAIVPEGGKRWIVSLVVLTMFGLLVSLGPGGGVFAFLAQNVPTFDLFRVPGRWVVWPMTALCLGAGAGLQMLLGAADRPAGERRTALAAWVAVALPAALLFAILWLQHAAMLRNLGLPVLLFERNAENNAGIVARFHSFASTATGNVALLMVVAAAAGTFALASPRLPHWGVAMLPLLCVVDLYNAWKPFDMRYPAGTEVPTETPYYRMDGRFLASTFYPETPLVRTLKERAGGARIHYHDSVISYLFDQDAREIFGERPIVQSLEITRGYQQLIIDEYAQDFLASFPLPEGSRPGAMLSQMQFADRRFLDAYNVGLVVGHAGIGIERPIAALGLEGPTPAGPPSMMTWRNPRARGWAWLSTQQEFLSAAPDADLGTVRIDRRDATEWQVTATTNATAWLHFASPDYSGWEIIPDDGGEMQVASSQSVMLPGAGEWTVVRRFSDPGTAPGNLIVSFLGFAVLLVVALRESRRPH